MRLKNYLFSHFAQIFFPIFLVLFFIASVVIFIRIAGVTFVVKMSFFELLSLYVYTLPTMIFFVIPISFFVACVVGLSRLSFDYELAVLFALGLNPKKIVAIFLPLALLVSASLFVFSLVLSPLSDIAYGQFLEDKKNSININLQAAEFGQKLGDWLVFVGEKKEALNEYGHTVLLSFSKDGGLILSQSVAIRNNGGIIEALLEDGKVYRFNQSYIEKIAFEQLAIRNDVGGVDGEGLGMIEYWKRAFYENDKQKKIQRFLCLYILVSLFPLMSLYYFLWIGIKNPRFQKNWTLGYSLGYGIAFYVVVYGASHYFPLVGLIVIPVVWSALGYMGYWYYISRYY